MVNLNGDLLFVQHLEKDTDRPTLVFLHDSLGCVALWRDYPDVVAEATGCNLLVYDRKGYGQSAPMQVIERSNRYLEEEADTLVSLLSHLNITRAILFGHSDGGSIALIAAARYPARVEAVIAEAAHIFVEEETLAGIGAAVKAYWDTNLKSRLARYHGEKTDDVFHAWTDTWLSAAHRPWNIEHFLPRIVCPTLIIQGEEDEYGTLKQVEGIARQVKGKAETFLLPGIGHTPHKEAPAETAERAIRFIMSILEAG